MRTEESTTTNGRKCDIQLIDFEYGGYNYRSFDIANHFNEWAGGTDNARPDYSRFPNADQRKRFLLSYLCAVHQGNEDVDLKGELKKLMEEVDAFVLVNHLYWGLWAVNQAKAEGCGDFDYLLYAHNRFQQFERQKATTNGKS